MKKSGILVLLLIILQMGCTNNSNQTPHVLIKTVKGDIELELYPQKAPKTVAAFLSFVDRGYYKDASFYRVLNDDNQPSNAPKTELIQGGIWKTNYALASKIPGIPHESTQQTGILHKDGVISLARSEPGTAGSEFFICIDDQPGLDYGGENVPDKQGYAPFGKVIYGMDLVRQIYRMNDKDQYFTKPVGIYNIVRL